METQRVSNLSKEQNLVVARKFTRLDGKLHECFAIDFHYDVLLYVNHLHDL